MLKREDSNKILKGVKVFLFATSLSLLNPINVKAQEITTQEEILENTENSEGLLVIGISTICVPIIMIGIASLLPLSPTYANSPKEDKKIKTIKLKDIKNG